MLRERFESAWGHHLITEPPIERAITMSADTLLLAEYGSRAYGTATPESDHDLMGIYLESEDQIYGLAEAKTRQTDLGRRSTSTDTDVTLHPLRKYVSLATNGNPTVLSLLWTPTHLIKKTTLAAELLIAHRELFVTTRAITAHIGYAVSQRKALTGECSKRTNRPELVEEHGYDTKFAMHLLRLLLQGQDLLRSGGYQLPMTEAQLTLLRSIRAGEVPLEEVLRHADVEENRLRRMEEEESDLPASPDLVAVNRLLKQIRNTALRS